MASAIAVPLVVDDRPIGVIGLWTYTRRRFSQDDVALLSLFAAQVAPALEAARQAEARYRSIFEDAVEGIFQVDPDGRLLAANPALLRMFGCASVAEAGWGHERTHHPYSYRPAA